MASVNFKYIREKHKTGLTSKIYTKVLNTSFTQLGMIFAVIGFLNLWYYLSRINQLPLLSTVISTPSVLLAIFASMSLILAAWITLFTLPSIVFLWLIKTNKLEVQSHKIVKQSLFLSIPLAISGAFPPEKAYPILIFVSMFYCCYLCFLKIYHNTDFFSVTNITALSINAFLILLLSIIYNIFSLSLYARYVRVFTLFINAVVVYLPFISIIAVINSEKKFRVRDAANIIFFAVGGMLYLTTMYSNGLIIKLNETSMIYSGLRSDNSKWFKIMKRQLPEKWLDMNWDSNKIIESDSFWLKGRAIFQSKEIVVICPEKTIKKMDENLRSKMTIFSDKNNGSMDTSTCILIENVPGNQIPILDVKKEYQPIIHSHFM